MLTALLLFNWVGYRFVLNHLQHTADLQLEARIDQQHYDDSQLIEIRVALNLPYQSNWSEYERYYGEIELDGKHYTYVKRKIEDGYLVLKCIPNHQKEIIKNTGNDFFKAINGIDQQNGNNTSPFAKIIKSLQADFDNDMMHFQVNTCDLLSITQPISQSSHTIQGFTTICEQPPDAACII